MKRVIIAFALLAVAVLTAVLNAVFLNCKINNLTESVNMLYLSAETYDANEANRLTEEIIKEWNKTEKYMKFVTVHDKLSEISNSFESLASTVNNGNKNEIKNICNEILSKLNILKSTEKLSVENILFCKCDLFVKSMKNLL